MKRILTIFYPVIICTLIFFLGCAPSVIPVRPDGLGGGDISLHLSKAERWTLPNGLVVHFLGDDEVPLVRGTLLVYGGTVFDPPDRAGLAILTGNLMRDGSIRGVSPDQFDEHLDQLSASIESDFSDEYGTIKFSALSSDFDEVFNLFAKVVREPAFDPTRVALAKKLALESIFRRKDDPTTMADLAFMQLVYGASSPYGRFSSPESILRIREHDLRDFHRQFVRPVEAHLIVVGPIAKEALRTAVERELGTWGEGQSRELPAFPAVSAGAEPGIYVLERDFAQASVIIGHQGPPRQTSDQYAMSIFNRYFGHGGFGTLLLSEVRTKLGLVYSIFGGLRPARIAGLFQIDLQTRNEEGLRAIARVYELIEEVRHQEPSGAVLVEAKLGAQRSFVFRFDSPDAILTRAALLELWNYPTDYDETYLHRIAAVTAKDVVEVPERWVRPSDLITVVVGGLRAEDIANQFAGRKTVFRLGFDTAPKVIGPVLPTK